MPLTENSEINESTDIAVIGMSGRFPGAATVDDLWKNICAGVESISHFSDDELLHAGIHPQLLNDPNYVKAGAVLDNIDMFDAAFFGLTPQEARVMDPQQRLFLECVWNALEHAGYIPDSYPGTVGLFGGTGISSYLLNNLYPNAEAMESVGTMQVILSNDKDSLVTRVAYLLNLTGPCYTVQTYCSTSLVAINIACNSLLNRESDLALAGGVAVSVPHKAGYVYQEGGVASPDARCRAFDAQANGSPLGSGVGVVVLKRLEDAIRDGDCIHGVIKGAAVNNDGSLKAGYTAPSVRGQALVIREALANAEVPADSIQYIEAHGTGTVLGDAVELKALIKAYQSLTTQRQFCAIGSVKTNVGHLDRAAGVTGFIKTVQALKNKCLPPSLNYTTPNTQVPLQDSPFYVNTSLKAWERNGQPRRAGVSAFGIGGTNAHVILEEAPEIISTLPQRPEQLFVLSARTEGTVIAAVQQLISYLQEHPDVSLADVAYTLQNGRKAFEYRCAFVGRTVNEMIDRLQSYQNSYSHKSKRKPIHRAEANLKLAFAFSDNKQCTLDDQISSCLYKQEPVFRIAFDYCQTSLREKFAAGLRHVEHEFQNFAYQYALMQLLSSLGVPPQAAIGLGDGEYLAAHIAGIMTLEDAFWLTFQNGQAIINDQSMRLSKPEIPYFSLSKGKWITEDQDINQMYGPNPEKIELHVSDSTSSSLMYKQASLVLMIGHQNSDLEKLRHYFPNILIITPFETHQEKRDPENIVLDLLGEIWCAGGKIDWSYFSKNEHRLRMPLPTYPFEKQRYWIEPSVSVSQTAFSNVIPTNDAPRKVDSADWFYQRKWQPYPAGDIDLFNQQALKQSGPYLIFLDVNGLGERILDFLRKAGIQAVGIQSGSHFIQMDSWTYTLNPQEQSDYFSLLQALWRRNIIPQSILYLWSMEDLQSPPLDQIACKNYLNSSIYPFMSLSRALGKQYNNTSVRLFFVTNYGQWFTDQKLIYPLQSMMYSLGTVIAQEYLSITCHGIDLDLNRASETAMIRGSQQVLMALTQLDQTLLAYRNDACWMPEFALLSLPIQPVDSAQFPHGLRQKGVYLITGGAGNVGLTLAEHLITQFQASVILIGHSSMPAQSEWEHWLQTHPQDDLVSQKIQKLQAFGNHVQFFQADVANEEQMRFILRLVNERYGVLHGVIHAAGISNPQAFRFIEEIGEKEWAWHLQAKVYGTLVLERILRDQPLDFCFLFSSLSTILGGLGFAAYSAANTFMDAIIHQFNQTGKFPWISIDWDTWQFPLDKLRQGLAQGQTVTKYAMSPSEGLTAFQRILQKKPHLQHIIVSTGDIQDRLRQWVNLISLQEKTDSVSILSSTERISKKMAHLSVKDLYEQTIIEIWREVLGIADIGLYDNFFELGGNSLLGLQVIAKLKKAFQLHIPAVALFEAPTVSALVKYILPVDEEVRQQRLFKKEQRRKRARGATDRQGIAIIGMSARFPGANTIEEFWQNLCQGVESISILTDEELLASGVSPELLTRPNYIKARPVLEQVDQFDAAFFGYSPREAALLDPQHRLFLECSWESLENAGYDPLTYPGSIGVFAGANLSTYLMTLATQGNILNDVDDYQIVMGNDKDSLTTSVSYKLNLKGPSFAVQTFCSTSLVAAHLACQSLLNGECDMALAGGVSVRVPTHVGYLYNDGGMESPDGHCRTFDAQAQGTLFGDGVGVVVLKRLEDALEDGDTINAVIKGSAINNDGSLKVSYTAPSVVGQTEVVVNALAVAGVEADTISYVEAHGTATPLGDPIELASLTKAYRSQTDKVGYCAIGSVKTNVGHLDRAAGISGLIKTVLSLQHKMLPPSLHYTSPNPEIDFEHSPFYVNTQLNPWLPGRTPRRAGLNSLGMGGTNAHLIFEEAPFLPVSDKPEASVYLLLLSARTETALEQQKQQLLTYLKAYREVNLADVAYTLQTGRHRFDQRYVLICRDVDEAIAELEAGNNAHALQCFDSRSERSVVFLFPGVGEQYPGMAHDLYQSEAVFRSVIDGCCEYVQQRYGLDLLTALEIRGEKKRQEALREEKKGPQIDLRAWVRPDASVPGSDVLSQTEVAQPAVFVIEYALAQLLQSWGIEAEAMMGYSLGEYVAACLCGVLSEREALDLVVQRARLIGGQTRGRMIAVMMNEQERGQYLDEGVSVAAINTEQTVVLAGQEETMERLEKRLQAEGVIYQAIQATHAFHTQELRGVGEQLEEVVSTIERRGPGKRYISNVTGEWIREEDVRRADYWTRHMCEPVQWEKGMGVLLEEGEKVLVEVGVGQSLGSLVRQHSKCGREQMGLVVATVPGRQEREGERERLMQAVGRLWAAGVEIDWESMYEGQVRRKLPLPTYPFERLSYWLPQKNISPRCAVSFSPDSPGTPQERLSNLPREALDQWFYLPGWKHSLPISSVRATKTLQQRLRWLIFVDNYGIGEVLKSQLEQYQQKVIIVVPGNEWCQIDPLTYTIHPGCFHDYEQLLSHLNGQNLEPDRIIHIWSIDLTQSSQLSEVLERGLHSLLYIAQGLQNINRESCQITVVSNQIYAVIGNEEIQPERATLLGGCRVIPLEYPGITSQYIDVFLTEKGLAQADQEALFAEIVCEQKSEQIIALRNHYRWIPVYDRISLAPLENNEQRAFRDHGVYLITGGLGGIGLGIAEYLARSVKNPRIALVSRTSLPSREEWPAILAQGKENNPICTKIHQIRQLEALGAEVLPIAANVSDEEQMRHALTQIHQTFGKLHGVFHTAGVPGMGLMQLKTPEMIQQVLMPKVQGTIILDRLLADIPVDFLILFSSITSITGGGPGQIDYCAANMFLNAFAQRHTFRHGRTIAIDWGEWTWNAWEAGLSGYDRDLQQFFKQNRQSFGITFAEGFACLQRIVEQPLPQVIVSTQHFPTLVELSSFFTTDLVVQSQKQGQINTTHTRPPLATAYVEPENEVEQAIASIWQEYLGIDQIGLRDNFFELGGHSLVGSQIILRLRQLFSLNLPMSSLFEAPTIAELAILVELALIEEIEQEVDELPVPYESARG